MSLTCKAQEKSFHQTTDKGHRKGHVLTPQLALDSRCCCLYYTKAVGNHSPGGTLSLLPAERKAEDAIHVLFPVKQCIIHHQFSPFKGTKLLPGDVSPSARVFWPLGR